MKKWIFIVLALIFCAGARAETLREGDFEYILLPEGGAILEIKVQNAMPMWLTRLLAEGRIYKGSFSKYGEAYRQQLVKLQKGKLSYV